MPTVVLSLVREHSQAMAPPRALWVPFELGRPLGAPGDAEFQRDVLRSMLGLLGRTDFPAHEDYPHEAPAMDAASAEGWACPIALPARDAAVTLRERLRAEIERLRPWYEESARRRARTAVGVSGLGADAIEQIGDALASVAEGEPPPSLEGATEALPRLARFLADDAKAYYMEAVTAQPGRSAASSDEIGLWLYGETTLGEVLFQLRDRARESEDPAERALRGVLIPGRFLQLLRSSAREPAASGGS